jgi:hypothetical protein
MISIPRMKQASALVAIVVLALTGAGVTAAPSVLFIGNSFLFGSGSPVRFYRADTVTDLNHEGIGGVPALFKSFAGQAGLDYDVSLETRGGSGLDFHLGNKLTEIGSRTWDSVVMHGFSQRYGRPESIGKAGSRAEVRAGKMTIAS